MLRNQKEVQTAKLAINYFEKAKIALEKALTTVKNDMEVAAYLFDAQKLTEGAHAEILKLRSKYNQD